MRIFPDPSTRGRTVLPATVAPGDRICLSEFPWYLKLIVWTQGKQIPTFAIAKVIAAGFVITGFYEDVWPEKTVTQYAPGFFATRAFKP